MGTFYNPRIVTNGLVLHLDAGNRVSYPGTGTSWYDLSGYGNHGSFSAAAPTYISGSLAMSGSTQYVQVADADSISITGDMSVHVWINITNVVNHVGILSKSGAGKPNPYDMYVLQSTGLTSFLRGNGGGYGIFNSTNAVLTGSWKCVSVSMSGTNVYHYTDAVANGSGTINTTITDNNDVLRIGARADQATWLNGKIATVMIYNRAITAVEVQQNFNALRGRFGV